MLSEAVAYEVTRLLHDNITGGTGTAAYTGCAGQAGKTGTTDNYTDAWFAGYQPNLATAVWVGYPQSNDISMTSVHGITVFGGTFPAEIWHSVYSERRNPLRGIHRAGGRRSAGRRSSASFTLRRRRLEPAAKAGAGSGGAPAPGRARSAATTRTPTRRGPARNRPRCPRRCPEDASRRRRRSAAGTVGRLSIDPGARLSA